MSSARAQFDHDKAIRHMRRRRRRIVQRRQRQRIMGAAAALAIASATALGIASFTGTDLAGAAVTRAAGLMELLDRRSPGQRTEGQLTKTKHRSIAEHLPAAPAVHVPVAIAQLIAAPPQQLVPVTIGSAPPEVQLFAPTPTPAEIFMPPSGGGSGGGGGGGGGGPGGPPGSPPNSPPLTPPAVPEPGTWMTMILGFGLIGWTMRRSKPPSAASAAR